MKKAVLSLSGGMDSSSLLLHLLANGYEVTALGFDYGQKHKVELERATSLVQYLKEQNQPVTHQIIKLDGLSQLLNSTLVDKINQLTEKGDQNIDYEYFAFIFPVIRNRVAHGKLITNDLELNAWLLLLDLSYACDLLKSSDLNINKNLACLSSAYKNKDIFSLIKLAPIFEHGIDSFYTEQITQLNDLKELLRMLLIDLSNI